MFPLFLGSGKLLFREDETDEGHDVWRKTSVARSPFA